MSEFDDALMRVALPEFVATVAADRRRPRAGGSCGGWADRFAVAIGASFMVLVAVVGLWSVLRP